MPGTSPSALAGADIGGQKDRVEELGRGQIRSGLTIVNFGCGDSGVEGYVNIDGSPTVLLSRIPLPAPLFGARAAFVRSVRLSQVRYGTARHLSFPKSSLDGFYASHVLEHLSRVDCEALLKRCKDWLKPEGVLRVVLPDLKKMARSYVEGSSSADRFVSDSHLSADGVGFFGWLFGHTHHRWMYDASSFVRLLRQTGYGEAEEVSFGKGAMPELTALDLQRRRIDSFYVEARC